MAVMETVKKYVSARIIVSVIVALFILWFAMWGLRKLGVFKPKTTAPAQPTPQPKPTPTPKPSTPVPGLGPDTTPANPPATVAEEEEEGTTAG